MFLENEKQMSKWNFEVADTDALFDLFNKAEAECRNALAHDVPIAAYEQAIEASHVFNLLNERRALQKYPYSEAGPGLPDPAYGVITARQEPRYGRLSVSYDF